jgi:tetratricopeptide (TPR) repeat protein
MARVSDEWFRSPAWDEAAQDEFERRLTSARPQARAQHLRLKALSLLGSADLDAARDLLLRSLDQEGIDAVARASALEQLGRIALQQGDRALAVDYYRQVLAGAPTAGGTATPGTTGTVEIGLAELLIDTREDAALDEAATLLSTWIKRSGLQSPAQLFRWNMALLRIAEADGDRETARDVARTALTLAAEESLLPRQKGAPRVAADPHTIDRLRVLAR